MLEIVVSYELVRTNWLTTVLSDMYNVLIGATSDTLALVADEPPRHTDIHFPTLPDVEYLTTRQVDLFEHATTPTSRAIRYQEQ